MNKTKLSGLSGQYLAALRTHFEHGPQARLDAAHALGIQALAIGLETLDLVKIHDRALAALVLPDITGSRREDMTKQASVFFTEVIAPLEKTHRGALEANMALNQLKELLIQRTLDLADANRDLQQGIIQRKMAVKSLKTSEHQSARLLEESRHLQRHLQKLAGQILTAQEEERKKMSLKLQDEIAQTLLAIHVRLLGLDKELLVNTENFKKEIANTQHVVEKSVETIKRFAGEFGIQHEN